LSVSMENLKKKSFQGFTSPVLCDSLGRR